MRRIHAGVMDWRLDISDKTDAMTEQHQHQVEVLVDIQASDLIRANLWYVFSQWSTRLSIGSALLFSFLGCAVFYLINGALGWYVLLPIAAVLLAATFPLVVLVGTWRNYSAARDFQKRTHYGFSGDHYEASDGRSSARISWESVLKAVESNHSFNLFFSRTLFAVIPKRCFKTDADIQTLRSILKVALGEKTKVLTD